MMGQRTGVMLAALLALIGCDVSRGPDPGGGAHARLGTGMQELPIDLEAARKTFVTRLLIQGPAPQEYDAVRPPSGVREATYPSGGLDLKAWVSDRHDPTGKAPVVVFLHGGWAFDHTDWADVQPFIDAGFVAIAPMLRGENGNPGEYQAFYSEVDDVVAVGRYAATLPGVDPERIFLVGHSVGGVLTVLTSMMPSNYRAAAALSGYLDMAAWAQDPDRRKVPYDPGNAEEIRLRDPMAFSGSLKIPIRLYTESGPVADVNREFARRAQEAGKSCDQVMVAGDHAGMKKPSIEQAIAWFESKF